MSERAAGFFTYVTHSGIQEAIDAGNLDNARRLTRVEGHTGGAAASFLTAVALSFHLRNVGSKEEKPS